ncbi:MAG: AAA family ATPase [bacterium]|nr:AAA family ATPase [bacterium]
MLTHLRIRDLIVVEEASLEFSGGFNVLSGSTGAGKSVLLAALGLVTGARAQVDWIRPGADRARVEAFYRLDEVTVARLAEHDFQVEDGELLLEREIRPGGKGQALLGGFPIPIRRLRELGALLVERQDQHEQLALIETERQLDFLDHFAATAKELDQYRQPLKDVDSLHRKRRQLATAIAELRREEDYLRFQLDEIDTIAPEPGELEELTLKEKQLRNATRIQAQLREAALLLEDGDNALTVQFGRLAKILRKLADLGAEESDIDLDLLAESLTDLAQQLREQREYVALTANEGERISSRLGSLHALERKHSLPLTEIITWADEQRELLAGLATSEDKLTMLAAEIEAAESELSTAAEILSSKRRAAASRLATAWQDKLSVLGLARCTLRIVLEADEDSDGWVTLGERRLKAGARGIDRIRILIRTNPDLPEGSLREIPSGGELSRIALARHLLGISSASPPLLVLDEVDAGLGADLAKVLAAQLTALARQRQIILVTHQASLAAAGDQQFCVRKKFDGARTRVDVFALHGDDRVLEISRMLGGTDPAGDGESRAHASILPDSETRRLAEALLARGGA